MNLSAFQGTIRPLITIGLVGAWVAYAHFDPKAAEMVKDTTLVVVSFWFGQRVGTPAPTPPTP